MRIVLGNGITKLLVLVEPIYYCKRNWDEQYYSLHVDNMF